MIKLRLFSRKKTTHISKRTKNHLQTDWVCHSGERPCVCWQRSRFLSLTRTHECTCTYIHARVHMYRWKAKTPRITRFFLYHGSITVMCLLNMTFIVLPDTKWPQGQNPTIYKIPNTYNWNLNPSRFHLSSKESLNTSTQLFLSFISQHPAKRWDQNKPDLGRWFSS